MPAPAIYRLRMVEWRGGNPAQRYLQNGDTTTVLLRIESNTNFSIWSRVGALY